MTRTQKRVCRMCVAERYLAEHIREHGRVATCDYCNRSFKAISVGELADHVQRALDQHFHWTESEPEGYDYYLAREGLWERPGEPVGDVISEVLEADEDVASDVLAVLQDRTDDLEAVQMGQEQAFSSDAHYAERSSVDDGELSAEFRRFEVEIIERGRTTSPRAREFLGQVFAGIDGLKTHTGQPAVVHAGPGYDLDTLFRARVFQTDEALERALMSPASELGPPPARQGRAGRLNAAGISIFYGADTEAVALAEVRPPVGSRVVVAKFGIVRPLRLLDIEALQSTLVAGSVFDPDYLQRRKHGEFLRDFSQRFVQPVLPDHETWEYIPTQAIGEYLANEVEPGLDGLIYGSAQVPEIGRNVALFHKASRVEALPDSKITNADVSFGSWVSEDEYEIDYRVFEGRRTAKARRAGASRRAAMSVVEDFGPPDERAVTLKVDPDTLTVRHVKAVSIQADKYDVRRQAPSKRNYDF